MKTLTMEMSKTLQSTIEHLNYYQRLKLVEFIESLSKVTKGKVGLLKFAGAIEPSELQLMKSAIENGCEKIDANEW